MSASTVTSIRFSCSREDPICSAWTVPQEKPEVLEGLPLETWSLEESMMKMKMMTGFLILIMV